MFHEEPPLESNIRRWSKHLKETTTQTAFNIASQPVSNENAYYEVQNKL